MPNNEFEKLTIGGNPIYARDSQARADIALLQAAYAGLTETDIIVGALPSSGTANKIYRVPGTGSYSDYMWDGTQFVLMATYTVDGLQAQVGYFVCSTAAASAAKEVTAASYVLGNGGAVKIKMDNANTANSVTLNINSQGAKTLFYEGSEASKYNSWKAGEIVVVFYDGTNYQAFNIGHDFADNIKSWSQKANDVTSAMTDTVRTTAGDESIDSDKGGVLLGISPNTEFTPSKLVSSGFNLLRLLSNNGLCKETADELAWFFPVPHLVATNDSIGTASENNGVLFTDSEGTNLTPAVRFQPIADGEPTAYTDGSAASYVTKDGRRHYVTSGIGWLIVPKTEITWATTCAHIGWSRRYDEYVSPTDANDAGTVIDLSALGTMRTVGAGGSFINDFAERTDATHMLLTTRVGRVKPTWVRGELDEETGLYTYTATVSGIVNDGIAEFSGLYITGMMPVIFALDKRPITFTGNYHIYLNQILACMVSHAIKLTEEYNVSPAELNKAVEGIFSVAGPFDVLNSVGLGLMAGSPDNFRIERNKALLAYGCEKMNGWLSEGCPKETGAFLEFAGEKLPDTGNNADNAKLSMIALILNEAVNAMEDSGIKSVLCDAIQDTLGLEKTQAEYYSEFGAEAIFAELDRLHEKYGYGSYEHREKNIWDRYFS